METSKGLLTKLGIFSGIGIVLVLIGKQHIADHNLKRFSEEKKKRFDDGDFAIEYPERGIINNFDEFEENENFGKNKHIEPYESRKRGDKLGLIDFFFKKP